MGGLLLWSFQCIAGHAHDSFTYIISICDETESGKNTALKSISASGHAISNDALSTFGSALASQQKQNTGMTSIAIGDEKMGDDGIIALCTNLEDVNGGLLESVDFAFKSISKLGAEMIGKTFGCSQSLKKLILYRNPKIGDDGLVALCNAAMQFASSSSSSVSYPFPALQYLDLSECNIGTTGIEALVACFVGGSEHLKEGTKLNTNLIDLNLNSNTLGSPSCYHLQHLLSSPSDGHSVLKSLSLKNCSISDDGIEILATTIMNQSCANLSSLDLSCNKITSKGAIALAKALQDGRQNVPDLNETCLTDNSLGEEGACALANALKQGTNSEGNSVVSKLDLTNTDCGINGAMTLMKCSSLSSLRLFNNNLGSEGIEALSSQLVGGHPHIQHLDLGGNRGNGESVEKLLRAIMEDQSDFENALKTLELGGNENNDESLFAAARKKRRDMDIAPVKETPKEVPSNET